MTKGDVVKAVHAVLAGWEPSAYEASYALSKILRVADFVKFNDRWVSVHALVGFTSANLSADEQTVFALVGPVGKSNYQEVSIKELVLHWCLRHTDNGDMNGYLKDFLTFACTGGAIECHS